MAKLLTIDVTNTCIKVAGSVGHQYLKHVKKYVPNTTLLEDSIEKAFRVHYKKMLVEQPNFGCYSKLGCRQWWSIVVTRTLLSCSYEGPTDLICQSLYDDFTDSQYWVIYDDVIDCLAEIKSMGLMIGAVSNFDERLNTILDGIGLSPFFDFVLTSYNEQCHKPNTQIFHQALIHANVSANETWHIGDDYDNDYVASTNAGLHALLLIRDKTKEPPTGNVPVIRTMREALEIIRHC